jgi:hypothetical protein
MGDTTLRPGRYAYTLISAPKTDTTTHVDDLIIPPTWRPELPPLVPGSLLKLGKNSIRKCPESSLVLSARDITAPQAGATLPPRQENFCPSWI